MSLFFDHWLENDDIPQLGLTAEQRITQLEERVKRIESMLTVLLTSKNENEEI